MQQQFARPTDGYTEAVLRDIMAIAPGDVPAHVIDAMDMLLTDTTGVMLGARTAPGVQAVHDRYFRWESAGTATALLTGARMSPPSAALVNATAAHALDFDDLHDRARVHTFCVLLPTLVAVAEQMQAEGRRVSGAQFFNALAIGAELNARLGLACQESLAHGWHPTMVFGILSGAVAGAAMMGLDARRVGDALGIALHQASGSAQATRDGSLSKRVGAGFAARGAVTAVFLAADGITGIHRSLEGTAGLYALYERDQVDPLAVSADWGVRWHAGEYSVKPYPCCRCNHSVIDLALALRAEGVRAEDVQQAELYMCELNRVTVGLPYDNPQGDVVRAQFNAGYGFSLALTQGLPNLSHYRAPVRPAQPVAELARRTRVLADEAMKGNDIEPARVRLTLRDGRVIERSTESMSGSPGAPMAPQALARKFDDCVMHGFGGTAEQATQVRQGLGALRHAPDMVEALAAALAPLRPVAPIAAV